VDLASLTLDDQVIVILGRGDRPGAIPFGRNTEVCQMVDRCTKLTTEQRAGERTVVCRLAIVSRSLRLGSEPEQSAVGGGDHHAV
jgi:hypothetical protein